MGISQRTFVTRTLGGTVALAVVRCGPGALSCEAPPDLTADQTAQRRALHYFDRSTNAARACDRCSFFTASTAGACGTCTLGLGPVNPAGMCDGFAARS